LGNNECHRAFFELARLVPGVIELHDAVPVFYGMHLDNYWKNRAEWLDLVAAEFGRPYADLKEELPPGELMFAPMIKTLTEGARGCIVHNEWCAELVREARPGLPLVNTGHGAHLAPLPKDDQGKRAQILARWGVPQDAVVFAAMGAIEHNRRLEEVLSAFYIARRIDPRLVLVFTGESSQQSIVDWLNSTVEAYGLSSCVKQLGYLELGELEALIGQIDVGVNLRWPTLGEASGMVTRLMAAGKCVLVTRAKQFCEYPDDACWKVPQGEHEVEALAAAMVELARHPERRRELGRRARNYIERFAWEKVAQTYLDFLTTLIE
jgi:glycosyltransferase involved in cell wall biosynthesis